MTSSTADIVKNLRDEQTIAETLPMWSCDRLQATMHAAADRIEELEREVWQRRIDFEEMHRDYQRLRSAAVEQVKQHPRHSEIMRKALEDSE